VSASPWRLSCQKRSVRTEVMPSFGILQRKCACGQHAGGGECEECSKKKRSLQRKEASGGRLVSVPPSVHEVLRSPGEPLGGAPRRLMEDRFQEDFSRVRVHSDAQAAASAHAVSALAYTVGRNVVFGAGRYAPQTTIGRKLLAHELTHVVQQDSTAQATSPLEMGDGSGELEAEAISERVAAGHRGTVRQGTSGARLQRDEDSRLEPPRLQIPPRPESRWQFALEPPRLQFPPRPESRWQFSRSPRFLGSLLRLERLTRIRLLGLGLVTPPPSLFPDWRAQLELDPLLAGRGLQGPSRLGEEEQTDVKGVWDLELELETDPQSPAEQALGAQRGLQELEARKGFLEHQVSVLSGEQVEATPLKLLLLNTGINLLGAVPQIRAVRESLHRFLHIDSLTIVAQPLEGTYGVIVRFEFGRPNTRRRSGEPSP